MVDGSSKDVSEARKAFFDDRWKRRLLGNAIENVHVVSASENRSFDDVSLEEKLKLDEGPYFGVVR